MVKNMKSKIGILGGTFDPIHKGHLELAALALKQFELEKVIFIPTGVSYMKTGVSLTKHRYEMCRLAISEYSDFDIDDEEIKREGNTYTYETLRYLKKKYAGSEICFIIGLDTLYSIESWKRVSEVLKNCTLLCANRLSEYSDKDIKKRIEELKEKYSAEILLLDMELYPVSSTEIRNAYYNGTRVEEMKNHLPECVADYIFKNGLYSKIEMLKREMEIQLKPNRYLHTIGVYETAVKLARIYGANVEKTAQAALLHDCAKHMSLDEMNKICKDFGVSLRKIEKDSAALLHGKAGAVLSNIQYDIDDSDVFDAIFHHTTGTPEMSLITQIIFVSDYIEPGRDHAPNLKLLRELSETDLNRTTALILRDTLEYLKNKDNKNIDEMTAKSYDFYKKYL